MKRPGPFLKATCWLAACAGWMALSACAPVPAERSAAAEAPPPAASAPVAVVAAPPAPPPAPPAPPPPTLPFDQAVLNAANTLLGKAQLPADGPPRWPLVIDPLIDGVTGAQSAATKAMGARIAALIKERYPQYELQPFKSDTVARSPLVLVGTFTGVNADRKTEGKREAFRICLALADLKSGKLVGKGLAFATPDGVDPTPTAFFRESPAVMDDAPTQGYIRTCQGTRAGDPIHPLYVDRILTATTLSDAMDAYNAGRYKDALALYESAASAPAGDQLRTWTGLYLANWKLGQRDAATKAFGKIVDKGLEAKRLGVKFLFAPGSTAFFSDPRGAAQPYPLWLTEIAGQVQRRQSCLEVVGHTSATGPEPLNERLSLRRAEFVKAQLERGVPALASRVIATGVGSKELMVGNGRDDASDALDRRVEFKVIGC